MRRTHLSNGGHKRKRTSNVRAYRKSPTAPQGTMAPRPCPYLAAWLPGAEMRVPVARGQFSTPINIASDWNQLETGHVQGTQGMARRRGSRSLSVRFGWGWGWGALPGTARASLAGRAGWRRVARFRRLADCSEPTLTTGEDCSGSGPGGERPNGRRFNSENVIKTSQ